MIDIEIEPHANGIGGDQIINIAGLIEGHLRIAGAGRKGTQHNGSAAALPSDEFGDGVHFLC